jgi:hypothetical protein
VQVPSGTIPRLVGTGAYFDDFDFDWQLAIITVGAANVGQTLEEPPSGTNVYAWAWHDQTRRIVPANTNLVAPFHMLDPLGAAHWDTIGIYYGYTNSVYPAPIGTLYHRLQGEYAWTALGMIVREGSATPTDMPSLGADQSAHLPSPRRPGIRHRSESQQVRRPDRLAGRGRRNASTSTRLQRGGGTAFTYELPIPDKSSSQRRLRPTNVLIRPTQDFSTVLPLQKSVRHEPGRAEWMTPLHAHPQRRNQSMINVRRSTSVWPKAYYQLKLLARPDARAATPPAAWRRSI